MDAKIRLFLDQPLATGQALALGEGPANYLFNVMRLGVGALVAVFNGRDGEWRCVVEPAGRRDIALRALVQTRPQPAPGDLHYLFAPLKSARLDYMAQKAVEMGVSHLRPVLTQRTQVSRIKAERLAANAIEAAEQCGILNVPEILPELKLERAIAALEPARVLIFCDEDAAVANPVKALQSVPAGPLALLIGPEGGFDPAERRWLAARPGPVRLSLGPRILRADTAAVAALAIVQSTLGDWGVRP